MLDTLFEMAKQALRITWTMTDDEEELLMREVEDSVALLDEIVGGKQDYTKPGMGRDLFISCVRYMHNDSSELFVHNFNKNLNSYRVKVASERLKKEGDLNVDN